MQLRLHDLSSHHTTMQLRLHDLLSHHTTGGMHKSDSSWGYKCKLVLAQYINPYNQKSEGYVEEARSASWSQPYCLVHPPNLYSLHSEQNGEGEVPSVSPAEHSFKQKSVGRYSQYKQARQVFCWNLTSLHFTCIDRIQKYPNGLYRLNPNFIGIPRRINRLSYSVTACLNRALP